MIALTKVLDTMVKDTMRIVKALRFGRNDVVLAKQIAPFGVDSNPPEGMKAIYANTTLNGEQVIVGYVNKDVLAGVGETRVFSVDGDGAVQAYVWCKASGDINLNGSANNLVRYTQLNTAVQNDIVMFINTQLGLIASGIATAGGSYSPGTMSVDISGAKVDTVKCP